MPSSVLDASALLALLQGEPGGPIVAEALAVGCAIAVVNVAEVLSKGAEIGIDPEAALRDLEELEERLEIAPLERADLVTVGELRTHTRAAGLSLADRACVALGRRLGVPVLTADRAWATLHLDGVEVRLIR